MKNITIDLIPKAIAKLGSFLKNIQIAKLLPMILVGLVVLTTNVDVGAEMSPKAAYNKVDKMLDRDDSNRPKTTGQWQQEAREVKGNPGERAKRIGEQSADAVKDFGAMYPDVAKRSTRELKNTDRDK